MRQVSSRCFIGKTITQFGPTDFAPALAETDARNPTTIILNPYGCDLVHALTAYTKLELAKEKSGVGGMIAGEQIGRPLGYANNAGIWGLIWDPKVGTDGSRRFIQGDRQVRPYADVTLLSGLCSHDPNPRRHAAGWFD